MDFPLHSQFWGVCNCYITSHPTALLIQGVRYPGHPPHKCSAASSGVPARATAQEKTFANGPSVRYGLVVGFLCNYLAFLWNPPVSKALTSLICKFLMKEKLALFSILMKNKTRQSSVTSPRATKRSKQRGVVGRILCGPGEVIEPLFFAFGSRIICLPVMIKQMCE